MRRLFVKANPNFNATTNPARNHIYLKRDDGTEQQILFAGFSYYGEVAGLRVPPPDHFVRLLSGGDNEDWQLALSDPNSTIVQMTYAQWMRFLSDHKVNQSRLFCFPEVSCFLYPILRYSPRHDDPNKRNKYDLNYVSVLYLNDLTNYIELARRKGIVVQISFASVQSLRDAAGVDDWNVHPFNGNNNINGYIYGDGRTQFCDIAHHPNYLAAEKRMVEGIVNAVKPYWNVMFELFNEPGIGLTGVVDWHRQVATWVHNLLRDPSTGERSHLVTFNAPAELLDPALPGGSLLAKLLLDGAGNRLAIPLVDAYQFHGSQWGGDAGVKNCGSRPQPPSTASAITTATRDAVNAFYDRYIDAAQHLKVSGSRIAVICDADAHSRAQDQPGAYASAAYGLKLSYVHRWMECYLTQGKVKAQAEGLAAVVPPGVSPPPDTLPAPAPTPRPPGPIEV